MKSLQRICLAMILMFLVLYSGFVQREQAERFLKQWRHARTQRFVQNMCKKGCLTLEEYLDFSTEILTVSDARICVEEYRAEWDGDGKKYYYLISWEEMKEEIRTTGSCELWSGSLVRLEVWEGYPDTPEKQIYYAIVEERN